MVGGGIWVGDGATVDSVMGSFTSDAQLIVSQPFFF